MKRRPNRTVPRVSQVAAPETDVLAVLVRAMAASQEWDDLMQRIPVRRPRPLARR